MTTAWQGRVRSVLPFRLTTAMLKLRIERAGQQCPHCFVIRFAVRSLRDGEESLA